jgi:hypothetical protein
MTKDEALNLAFAWYGSGNQDPDEFERLILSIVAQPEQEPTTKAGELRAMKTELWKQREQDGKCKYCTDGCPACDARKLPEQEPFGYASEGAAERLTTVKQAHEQIRSFRLFTHDVPLYTHPPQRTWVGLTKEERHEISMANRPYCANIMAAHEEELKRRNT